MRFFFIAAFSVLVISISSCNPADKYEAEIAEIDSCLALLDSIEIKYNGIEFDSLKMMVEHVKANEDSIHKYYRPDTLSLEVGTKMNESKGVRKKLSDVDQRQRAFDIEIPATRKQLMTLKTDISNGVLSEDKIKQYLMEEKDAFNKLNIAFKNFYTMQKQQKSYYYAAVPYIDKLIEQLINEAQQE
jgi:hypothetical protein